MTEKKQHIKMMAIAGQKPVTTARRWLRMASEDGSFKTKQMLLVLPQIALAMGVLTSNTRGVGSRWVPLLRAIAGCHCWAPLLECHCWVPPCMPLLGAIAGVPWLDASYQLRRGSR